MERVKGACVVGISIHPSRIGFSVAFPTRVLVPRVPLLDHIGPADGPHLGPRRVALRYEVLRVVPAAAAAERVAEVPERAPQVHLHAALRRRHLLGVPAAKRNTFGSLVGLVNNARVQLVTLMARPHCL